MLQLAICCAVSRERSSITTVRAACGTLEIGHDRHGGGVIRGDVAERSGIAAGGESVFQTVGSGRCSLAGNLRLKCGRAGTARRLGADSHSGRIHRLGAAGSAEDRRALCRRGPSGNGLQPVRARVPRARCQSARGDADGAIRNQAGDCRRRRAGALAPSAAGGWAHGLGAGGRSHFRRRANQHRARCWR